MLRDASAYDAHAHARVWARARWLTVSSLMGLLVESIIILVESIIQSLSLKVVILVLFEASL